ncbi:helix-turn-helix transcriptional regulator [Gordonia rhizosphera]|uniref:Putative DeoR family transcriptional regulator n=1 Tax=Gordonia rhizosphera NBRC 16068 TaxID=1108045 RepID=K6VY50_9ACTN|nr:YafY family protein [Gordonia rhizosphera]GAB91810.1 putative DeoR family transcriptional regulator [Gordonia rhizosphera NBRC 16068]
MLQTSARLLELLSLLQLRRDWTSSELADRLDVSARTVRADISKLRSLGYPVNARPGVAGGYRLAPGAAMPPLLLDDDEAVAVAIGLGAVATGRPGAEEASLTALAKLEQVLPAHLRRRVDAVREATSVVPGNAPLLDLSALSVVASAIRGHERLRFGYTKPERGEQARHVEPQRLVNWGLLWYLLAWDLDRDDWRIFRVDRMTPRPPTGVTFRPRAIPDRDVIDYVSRRITTAGDTYHARVLVHASATTVAAKTPFPVAVESIDSSTCILEIDAGDPARLALWLTQLDTDLEVIDGNELALAFDELAARLHRASGTPGPLPSFGPDDL